MLLMVYFSATASTISKLSYWVGCFAAQSRAFNWVLARESVSAKALEPQAVSAVVV